MIEKAKLGCFDFLIFWKVDRFSRSLTDLCNVERTLRQCGVSLSSATEFIDTTSSVGRFNFRSIGSVAELESELISERAKLGLNGLGRAHRWPNRHAPLGFELTQSGHLKILSKEARLVRKIFRMYLKTKSMAQIAFVLNQAKTLTKNGLMWTASAVRTILTNKIYIGFYSVAGVEDHIENCRIIRDDVFAKAEEIRLRYRQKNSSRPEMQQNRKQAKAEKVIGKYLQILKAV
jgi:site-specific DNA recombinase